MVEAVHSLHPINNKTRQAPWVEYSKESLTVETILKLQSCFKQRFREIWTPVSQDRFLPVTAVNS